MDSDMNEREEVENLLPPGLLNLLRTCPVPDLRAPMDKVCGVCGKKHTGPFQTCSPCKTELDAGR